jgi:hypothetical protein
MARFARILWETAKFLLGAFVGAVLVEVCHEFGFFPEKTLASLIMTTPSTFLIHLAYAIIIIAIAFLLLFAEHWLGPIFARKLGFKRTETKAKAPTPRGDWPLRQLFRYLAPHLPLRAARKTETGGFFDDVDDRWKPVGQVVLNELSRGRLHATGRKLEGTKRLNAAPIPQTFWTAAKFTYWFLDEGRSTVQDASNGGDTYAEIEVYAKEAVEIWPEDISLFEAATQAFEELRYRPISVVTELMADSSDEKLVAYGKSTS